MPEEADQVFTIKNGKVKETYPSFSFEDTHSLAEAIRQVSKGETYFSPAVAQRYRKLHETAPGRKGEPKAKITDLTPREMEVLQQVAEGAANKQVAAELGISIKTVEKHRDNLMRKLDIHDTASLTRYAVAAGIIESSVHVTNF